MWIVNLAFHSFSTLCSVVPIESQNRFFNRVLLDKEWVNPTDQPPRRLWPEKRGNSDVSTACLAFCLHELTFNERINSHSEIVPLKGPAVLMVHLTLNTLCQTDHGGVPLETTKGKL